MNKWWVIGVLVGATALVFLLLKYEVQPSPTGVMKPSFFTQPQEIGAVVYRRFYVVVEERKVVVFGIPPQPEWHRDILLGFLRTAAAEKRPFDAVIVEADMPRMDFTSLPGLEIIEVPTNTATQTEFIEALKNLRQQNKRVLVYTANLFSTHLLQGNPVSRYEATTGEHLFSITSAPLALKPDQEFIVDPPCVGSQRDMRGTADLGCAVLQAGRRLYRKNLPTDRTVAIMNEQRPGDFLLMVAKPTGSKL